MPKLRLSTEFENTKITLNINQIPLLFLCGVSSSFNMKIKYGSSRTVILTKKYAYKLPYIGLWKNFLWGLIANMNEVEFNRLKDPRLAKVIFHLPAGFLVVMKKAKPLGIHEWNRKKFAEFSARHKGFVLPTELKPDSFGYIEGKLVAIDYG